MLLTGKDDRCSTEEDSRFDVGKGTDLRLLSEKFTERFAITRGEGERVHLFVIKFSLWGSLRTFVI